MTKYTRLSTKVLFVIVKDRKPESIIMGQVKEIVIQPKNGILCIPKKEMRPYLRYKYEGFSKTFNER